MSFLLALAAAATLLRTEAPACTILHPPSLSARAAVVAKAIPNITQRLGTSLEAPELPPFTLCLLESDPPDGGWPGCEPAAWMPPWAAGLAAAESRTAIVRVDRSAGYPHRQFMAVVAHEAAHLAQTEAAGGAGSPGAEDLPIWFREGVAATLAHEGEWMDFVYLWTSPVAGSDRPLVQVEGRFAGIGGDAGRRSAYAGAYSFLRHLADRHGDRFPALVLAGVREGLPFEAAFARASGGSSVREEEALWAASLGGLLRWLTVIGSGLTLWVALAALVVAAWLLKRRRARRLLERWEEEERLDGL